MSSVSIARPPPNFTSVTYPASGVSTSSVAAIVRLQYADDNDTMQVLCTTLSMGAPNSLVQVNGGVNISSDQAVKQSSQFWSTPSDSRIKTEVRDLEAGPEADHRLLQYRVVRYRYREPFVREHGFSPREQIGLIADEVLATHPEAVDVCRTRATYGLDEFKTVNPHSIFYEMLGTVQSLCRRVEALEAASRAGTGRAGPGPSPAPPAGRVDAVLQGWGHPPPHSQPPPPPPLDNRPWPSRT